MRAWQTFALITSTGEVGNIISYLEGSGGYTLATVEAVKEFGTGSFAIDVTFCRVGVHDTYHDSKFWRNNNGAEVEIPWELTDEQEIENLKVEQEDTDAIILDQEERLIALESAQ